MTWLTDNKKYAVWLGVIGLTMIEMGLTAAKLPTVEGMDTAIIMLLTLGVKEWLNGVPDKLK